MYTDTILLTIMTHPLQVLLIGMILCGMARGTFGTATETRQTPPMAERPDLRAA